MHNGSKAEIDVEEHTTTFLFWKYFHCKLFFFLRTDRGFPRLFKDTSDHIFLVFLFKTFSFWFRAVD